ncbi:MAG: hypothetical protein IAE67_07110 [Candidatus Competibacteraceae bacterium]|nr:hypothetical protein [Candidatus Competibacteraceae bacterium]
MEKSEITNPNNARNLIVQTLRDKSVHKQEVFSKTKDVFKQLKTTLLEVHNDLLQRTQEEGVRLHFNYQEKGDFEVAFAFAGDTLIFHMHTNVFNFDRSNAIWKTTYVKENENRAYCGVINIYNFLTDSFKYNREQDIGYLIARIFINHEKHYFVEGKRQLGFLYNDFANATIDTSSLTRIIESAVLYSLDFDLLTPGYDQVKQVSVQEIYAHSESLQQRTGKRMGFLFQADNDDLTGNL